MTNQERISRTKTITLMFTCYGQGSDAERIVAYVNMLSDIPLNILDKACQKAISQSKFLPSIAEIIEAGRGLVEEQTGNRTKTWAEAQNEIRQGLTRTWFHGCLGEPVPDELYGKSCEPKWSTPEVKAAVDSYGYENIGKVLESDMPIVWAQIRKAYEQACNRKREAEMNGYLLGGGNEIKSLSESIVKKIGRM